MSPLELYLSEYNITEMEELMHEIQPLYEELHAFIRSGLQRKYDDSIIESDGLIPHHLFEQVQAQAWTNDSIIDHLFPFEDLPPVESVLQKRFKPIELYEIADGFYQKLGFTEIPYQIWSDRIRMRNYTDDEDASDCTPYVYYSSPNVYLLFCEKMNFAQFLNAYSDVGKLYYAKVMTGLPAYFFATQDLDEAIGRAAILSASTHHNLKAIGMILDFNFTEEVEMNRLLRKSIESLTELPVKFVHVKLMAGLMLGSFDVEELNAKYWELMKEYVGVKPPTNFHPRSDTLNMPFSFYSDLNENLQATKFDSEILSYQMYKKFCELGEKYPQKPLHLYDMHGTKAAGDLLKKMMRLGNSKPYTEVLATMFPENPKTSAEGILEYYSPLKKLLAEKNSEANAKVGWKH